MDDKQRRLIEYFAGLRAPAPPARRPAVGEAIEESLETPPPPASPPRVTPESVAAMLAQLRAADQGPEIEEGISPPAALETARAATTPFARPRITDRVVEVGFTVAKKALAGQELDADEEDLLEAIIVPGERPVVDIIKGDFSTPPAGWEFLADYRALIQGVLPAVGRIDIPELTDVPYGGTGFFVGDGLLLTNRHVARNFVQGVGAGRNFLTFLSDRSARFDPRYEVDGAEPAAGEQTFEVTEALLVHPHWDAALLRVKPIGEAQLPKPLALQRDAPSHLGGGGTPHVVVVGYPALDGRSHNIAEQLRIFNHIFGRKRLMPGYLTGYADIKTKWETIQHATKHDASTLGGNSGSAIIDLVSGNVLALHFGGEYLVSNYGVPAWELALDSRVTDLGVNFVGQSGPPAVTPPNWASAWNGLRPLVSVERPAVESVLPTTGGAPNGTVLPAAPDWFERTSDTALVEAMRRDPVATESLVRQTLLPAEADDLLTDLRRATQTSGTESVDEGVFDFLTGGTKVDESLPEIILLHGMMGGHLTARTGLGGRIWLSPLAFAAGAIAQRLTLADDGEREKTPGQLLYPDGVLRLTYEKAARKWRMGGFIVHEFAYDWRKSIANAADRLHYFIESLRLERPWKRFALVGHSMGGLVAALYAARHPEWSTRVAQAILIGAPVRGAYAVIEGLLGEYPVLVKVAAADLRASVDDYTQMVRTLPGLIDMLPDPDMFPDAAPLYARATWAAASAPAQVWLDQSRQIKRTLATSPILETANLIVSFALPTVAEVSVVGGTLQPGRRNRRGDGTVPLRSAAGISGARVYGATYPHAELPREDQVIAAVMGLLRDGRCDLPMLSRALIEDPAVLEEAVVESLTEAAAIQDGHFSDGIFTQRDVDFLMRADHSTLPGPVAALSVAGRA